MSYKFIVRQQIPEFYMGNQDYPVMDACVKFLKDIHNEDKNYSDIPAFEEDLQRYPAFLSEKGIEVTEKEMRTNPTLAPSHGLDRAYSIIVVSELSYVPYNICWLGNLVPEDMMDVFYEWVEIKEEMAKSMQDMRSSK